MEDRIPETPPVIKPVDNSGVRPLFSVMIPAYNCIPYLEKTIESVLCQDLGPEQMQIEVVDDCSTDGDVQRLVEKIGKGRVGLYQQNVNKGSLRNFETCLNRAKGYYIHLLHGDDLVKPGFYEEINYLFSTFPAIGSAITSYSWTDEYNPETKPLKNILNKPGIIDNWLYLIASKQMTQPPAVVVKREVYERLGGFFGMHYGEDWEMWIRIASKYPVAYSPKCLAVYRALHDMNISTQSILSGRHIADINKAIEVSKNHLPAEKRRQIKNTAKRNFSRYYAKTAFNLYIKDKDKNKEIALKLVKSAIKLHLNPYSFYWFMYFLQERFKKSLLNK